MSKLYVNPSLAGVFIAADPDVGAAGIFVQWPDAPDGWSQRERYKGNRVRLREIDAELAYGTGWPGAPGCGRPTRAGETSERYTLRLTPTERTQWTELADQAGQSLAEWMRARCAAAAALVAWSRSVTVVDPRRGLQRAHRGEQTKGEGAGAAAEQRNPQAQLELPGADAPL